MRAAVLYDVDDIRIEERDVPTLQPGEVLVRTGASGICSGDVMAWYVKRKAPLVLGHEPAGTVAALGAGPPACDEDGRPFAVGDRVFVHHHAPCFACRACARGSFVQCATWRASRIDPGGLADYFRVPQDNLRDTLRVPDGMALVDASLIEPLACVVKSLRRSGLQAGDSLYVIGLGVMGLMHVLLGLARGARVYATDVRSERCARAAALGATIVAPQAMAQREGGADVVVCGPGSANAMAAAFEASAPDASVVMFTPFEPGTPLAVDPERFYFGDRRLVASYSCGPPDTRAAREAIGQGIVTAQALGATTIGLDEVPRAYRDLAEARITKPIVVF